MQKCMSRSCVAAIRWSQSHRCIVHSGESSAVLETYLEAFLSIQCEHYSVAVCPLKWRWWILSEKRLFASTLFTYIYTPQSHHWYFRYFLSTDLIVHKHHSESYEDWLLYLGVQSPHTKQTNAKYKEQQRGQIIEKDKVSLCINMLIKWKQRFYMKMSLYDISIILLS